MPSSTDPRSGLKSGWTLGENNWNTDMDANLLSIGRFAYHLSVKDRNLSAPPVSPVAGDSYIVGPTATGAWAGKENQVTVWSGSAWVFGAPRLGWVAYVEDEVGLSAYGGTGWSATLAPGGAIAAADIANTPAGNITATNVQAAINELDAQARERLSANRTYYVSTTGLDSNDGLSAGSPFLTVQKAIDATAAIDISIYDVDIQLVDGTYGAGCVVTGPWVGSGTVTVKGNATTPANVLLSTGAADSITVLSGGRLNVESLKLTNTGSFLLCAAKTGSITFSNLDFGATGAQQIRADDNGVALAAGNYTISGGGANHYNSSGGVVRVQGRTITLIGTPAFASFATAEFPGLIIANGNTYSGAATGARYHAAINGAIVTRGGGAAYFPGDVAGTIATGGQYD